MDTHDMMLEMVAEGYTAEHIVFEFISDTLGRLACWGFVGQLDCEGSWD